MFHFMIFTPYRETQEHRPNFIKPPPDLINGQEEYEVEAILGHRKRGPKWIYLTKWKGYGSNDNTWEPESNLINSKEILEAYKKTHNLEDNSRPLPKPLSKRNSSVLSHSSTRPTHHSIASSSHCYDSLNRL
jgi:Chromo (CHRromatin Organisation MOdifier) domain